MHTERGPRDERPDSRARLRLLSVLAPLAGVAALYGVRRALLRRWPLAAVDAAVGALATAGIVGFSWTIFGLIARQDRRLARQHAEIEARYATERALRAQREALQQAALSVASARTPAQILQHLVDLACALIGARYGALGVLGAHGAIDAFYTAGLSADERARIGPLPQGHGLLGVLLCAGQSLRVPALAADPRAVGFPPGHPPMRTLLGVAVAHRERVVGSLYLADKDGGGAFSPDDERLLTLLAAHAAVVIEHARLAAQVQALAVVAERARIGTELHDGVIQALYAVNLELEDAAEDIAVDPAGVRVRLEGAIDRLGEVMKEVRGYILGLQADGAAARTLSTALAAVLAEARAHTLIEPQLRLDGAGVDDLPPAVAHAVLQIAREAVANVVRHAQASRLWLTLEVAEREVRLRIVDNGRGFDVHAPVPPGHAGLRNLHARAGGLGGTLSVISSPRRGTALDVRVPLPAPVQEAVHA